MKIAVVILTRNLPEPTNQLCRSLLRDGWNPEDLFVLEAGSEVDRLSEFCTWHVRDTAACTRGLRFNQGMNQALVELYQSTKWNEYDAFFLITNDTEFRSQDIHSQLEACLLQHKKVGIVSPCSKEWGESQLLPENGERYCWFIHSPALVIRRAFIESVANYQDLSRMNFLFDGENFRGYLSDIELIAKGYVNGWASAITSRVYISENTSYLKELSAEIQTETYDDNLRLYVEEGLQWAHKKYGFKSRWDMQRYARLFFERFFLLNPHLSKYQI